jgi:hypothetical protein
MNLIPFIFVDGWRLYSSNGKSLYITDDDLKNYEENGLSHEEIKSISFAYLTSQNLFSFDIIDNIENEF